MNMRDCKKLMHKNAKNPKNLDINPLPPWENMGFFYKIFGVLHLEICRSSTPGQNIGGFFKKNLRNQK